MNICLFTPEEIAKPLSLSDARAEHILKILHKKEGDTFTAGILGGSAGIATICAVNEKAIHFTFAPTTGGKPLCPLTMIIGFPRPIQLKRLLRDMAGLGVKAVHLTATDLGEKSYLKSSLANPDSCRKMLLDGITQAGSTHLPALFIHTSLKDCLEAVFKAEHKNSCAFYALDNIAPQGSLVSFLMQSESNKSTVAAIGSERGWTNAERSLFKQNGYTLLSMGERILRTETAATVSASLILGAMGYLR